MITTSKRRGPEDDHNNGKIAAEHDEDGKEQLHRHHEQKVAELLVIKYRET